MEDFKKEDMEDLICIDMNEEIKYINKLTGISEDIINKVFDADTQFLKEKGIITVK